MLPALGEFTPALITSCERHSATVNKFRLLPVRAQRLSIPEFSGRHRLGSLFGLVLTSRLPEIAGFHTPHSDDASEPADALRNSSGALASNTDASSIRNRGPKCRSSGQAVNTDMNWPAATVSASRSPTKEASSPYPVVVKLTPHSCCPRVESYRRGNIGLRQRFRNGTPGQLASIRNDDDLVKE
jgi:hypothetical protein